MKQDRARALQDFDRALRLQPRQREWRVERAKVLFQQQSWQRALEDLDMVLAEDPQSGSLMRLRGRCHAALGNSTAALKDFNDAMAMGEASSEGDKAVLLAELLQFEHSSCVQFGHG